MVKIPLHSMTHKHYLSPRILYNNPAVARTSWMAILSIRHRSLNQVSQGLTVILEYIVNGHIDRAMFCLIDQMFRVLHIHQM